MALPDETASVIQFLRPAAAPEEHYSVSRSSGGAVRIDYYDAEAIGQPQPTELELTTAAADGTLVDHGDGPETFSSWQAKRGGNAAATLRHRAKQENIDGTTPLSVGQRAELGERNKRDNYLVNRIIQLENVVAAMLDSTGGAANIRTAGIAAAAQPFPQTQTVAAAVHFAATATRDRADARASLKAEIDSGNSDT